MVVVMRRREEDGTFKIPSSSTGYGEECGFLTATGSQWQVLSRGE